jgi:hypothetical protein
MDAHAIRVSPEIWLGFSLNRPLGARCSCLVWSLTDPQSRPFLKGGNQMPICSPELIHTMRAALDEVITKNLKI